MLDISFYNESREPTERVEVAESFLEWLAHSEFSKIGKEESIFIKLDNEEVRQPLVKLDRESRQRFIDFFNSTIISETKILLDRLESLITQKEEMYRLRKLIKLLDCTKNDNYYYLQRF